MKRERAVNVVAYSLVELMVAIGLFAVVLAFLALSRFGPTWAVFDPLTGDLPDLAPIEQQLRKMVVEIQEGTGVFYPVAGKGPQEGLGIVNSRGEAILYYLEPGPDASAPSVVHRMNATGWQRHDALHTTPFLANVRQFQINVAPAAPGKEASLVEMDVGVEVPLRSGRGVRLVNLVNAAFARNLESHIPDDLFPAGTPLVDPP